MEAAVMKMIRTAVLGVAAGLIGCIVPPPLTTETEVVTSADSTAVFGPRAELRLYGGATTLTWDEAARIYRGEADGLVRSVRVGRLKGDVFLFQAHVEELEGYALLLARVSNTNEVTPLACAVDDATAGAYGVRLMKAQGLQLWAQARGDRAGILGLLTASLGSCHPLLKVDKFLAPRAELAAAAAGPGRKHVVPGCRSCPARACFQGTVTDESGAVLPGATIRLDPSPVGTKTVESQKSGEFFLEGVPGGRYRLGVQMTGFASVWSQPLSVRPGFTYFFEAPLPLKVATVEESVTISLEPLECGEPRIGPKR